MPGGRPRKYTKVEDVEDVIDTYFATLKEDEVPSMSGLAYALDMSTESLRRYSHEDEFCGPIKKARQAVERFWEQSLHHKGGSGPIFWLKNNAGWKDKTETTHGVTDELQEVLNTIGKGPGPSVRE